jgi:hypothetical protein
MHYTLVQTHQARQGAPPAITREVASPTSIVAPRQAVHVVSSDDELIDLTGTEHDADAEMSCMTNEAVHCPVCHRTLSALDISQQLAHVNECLDRMGPSHDQSISIAPSLKRCSSLPRAGDGGGCMTATHELDLEICTEIDDESRYTTHVPDLGMEERVMLDDESTFSSPRSTSVHVPLLPPRDEPVEMGLPRDEFEQVAPVQVQGAAEDTKLAQLAASAATGGQFEARAVRRTATGFTSVALTAEEIGRTTACTVYTDVLPRELADAILKRFVEESKKIRQGKGQYIYDKRIAHERLSTGFTVPETLSPKMNGSKRDKQWELDGFMDELRYARSAIASVVKRERAKRPKPPAIAVSCWMPNYCAVNIYRTGEDYTGVHSDPLTSLGPQCIIGSLSLGAARTFRLKPADTTDKSVGETTSYSLRLPHNSLLVMWEGCQENFRHEVPKEIVFPLHEMYGPIRVNLTFRQRRFEWSKRAPLCACGSKAKLKPVLKPGENYGRYCWLCPSHRGPSCGFFEWNENVLVKTGNRAVDDEAAARHEHFQLMKRRTGRR